jgi:hypothetical protein
MEFITGVKKFYDIGPISDKDIWVTLTLDSVGYQIFL